MLTVERTFRVVAPAAFVVDYLSDFSRAEEWDPGTVSCTRIDNGPIAVGARFHNVSEFRGKQTELQYQLTLLEPAAHLIFVGNNKTVTSTDDMTFRAEGDATVVKYRASLDFHGLAKFASPFLRKTFESLADKTQAQMTAVLERQLHA
jgi:carbon monoxide dehydrogenase subunit G